MSATTLGEAALTTTLSMLPIPQKQGVVQGFRTTQQSLKISHIPNIEGNDAKPQDLDSNFVGRDRQIAELHTLISRGAKVILIQGEGGVGKTTFRKNNL